MDEKHDMSIKDLLIRLILIIIFIFLLIWLFPMPDLKPLNNQIFADNLDRMKDVAKSYYTVERLPKDINETKKMTLKEMIDKNYILPLMDSNGNYCSPDDSYVEITKLENEYVIKTYLSCSDKKDFIIEHYGCYDICSDKCKILETTTGSGEKGGKVPVTKITTKKGKLYEYQFVKTTYDEIFDKYVCPSGYNLVSDKCIKNGSKVETVDAKKNVEYVTSTDTKDAKAIVNSSTTLVDAECKDVINSSTIAATPKENVTNPKEEVSYKNVAAIKQNIYDNKPAVAKRTTVYSDYIVTNKYDVITATKYLTGYTNWQYDHTHISTNPNEAYEKEFEKKVLVKQYLDFTCTTCTTTVWKYMYFISTRKGNYSYSCDRFPGYTLYEGNKCRKKLPDVVKTCPTGFDPDGDRCKKVSISDYSCAPYGSDYVYNASDKSCKKLIGTKYTCPTGTKETSDEKICKKEITNYVCTTGNKVGDKCVTTTYSCPKDTSDTKYTLSGDKCIVETKSKVCTCPKGTNPTNDPNKCAKDTSKTTYTCEAYPGYTLTGNKCVNTVTTEKITYTCNTGYVLNGTSCTKTVNVSDTKNAEKTYKIISDTKYKWSTKTELGDGWVFTGNVREIK